MLACILTYADRVAEVMRIEHSLQVAAYEIESQLLQLLAQQFD
jgi:hypothetical protein